MSAGPSGPLHSVGTAEINFQMKIGDYLADNFQPIKVAADDSIAASVRLVPTRTDTDHEAAYGFAVIGDLTFLTDKGDVTTDKMIIYFEH